MNVTDLYYDFPQAAYLLFFIVMFLVLFWFFYQYKQRVLSEYTNEKSLVQLLIPNQRGSYWWKSAAFCLAWILLCLAFMQPKGDPRYPPEVAKNQNVNTIRLQPHEVIFLIDTSASMTVPDGRIQQTRLENAKEIADQAISRLKGQSGSLYAFTSAVTKLSPPSMDYLFMRLMLRNMTINEGDISGTDIKAALQYIHDQYLNSSIPLIKTLVIISDGGDNRYDELDTNAQGKYVQELMDLLGDPAKERLRVYTIGVGTQKGGEIPNLTYEGKPAASHLNEELLTALATKGGGRYYPGAEYAAVDIAADLADQIAKADIYSSVGLAAEMNPSEDLIYNLYFQFPLGLAILILGLSLFWPETAVLKQNILKRSMLLCILLFPFQVTNAENIDQKLWLANAYVEAKDFPEAIQMYQSLLNGQLSGWERSIVTYNLGTALADQGNYEQAINVLQRIPLDNDSSPVLAYKVRNNLAAANFRYGKALSDITEAQAPTSQDPYFKTIYFFKQALEAIPFVEETQCRLYQISGENHCPHNSDLGNMETLSKVQIAHMRVNARNYLFEEAKLQQGLPWLATGFSLLGKDLQWMLETEMSSSLRDSYQQLLYQNAVTWKPLLEALKKKISDQKDPFAKIEADYSQTLTYLNQGDFGRAKESLATASDALSQLMNQIFSSNPFHSSLASLSNDFSLASMQDPLEPNVLFFIQQKLNEITVPKEKETYKAGIDAVKDNLEHSLEASERQNDLLAQMYFNEAWQQIKRMLLLFAPDLKTKPELILDAAIVEQRHALLQARLLSQLMEKQENVTKSAKTFVTTSQEYLSAFVNFFYDAAYARQMLEFSAEVPENGEDDRCQYHPWNEVIPIFQEGNTNVSKTIKLLKSSPLDLNLIIQKQEQILNLWKDALAQLKAPKKTESCHSTPLANQPSDKNIPQAESFESLARLIQQMNAEDQRPAGPSTQIKEGLKPW